MTFKRISGIGSIRETIKQKLTASKELKEKIPSSQEEVSKLIQDLNETSFGELDEIIDDLKALKARITHQNNTT